MANAILNLVFWNPSLMHNVKIADYEKCAGDKKYAKPKHQTK